MELTEELKEYQFKVIIIGESATGKTSLVNRYTLNNYTEGYKATIGADFCNKVIDWLPGVRVNLHIWDLAGQERLGTIIKAHFRRTDGVMCVLDINQPNSAVKCKEWSDNARDQCTDQSGELSYPPTICLGNKYDLFDANSTLQQPITEEETSIDEGVDSLLSTPDVLLGEEMSMMDIDLIDRKKIYEEDFTKSAKAERYADGFLVSALTGENVDDAFKALIVMMIDRYEAHESMEEIERNEGLFKLTDDISEVRSKGGYGYYAQSCNKC
tara:strand:- start:94991 stop:95800 length:810 start_codon:yes stop_codon:yes gene_type:complete